MFQFSNHIFNIAGIERGKERENRKENARCVHVQPNVMNNRQISRAGLGQDESIDSSWPRVWYDTVVLWMTTYIPGSIPVILDLQAIHHENLNIII